MWHKSVLFQGVSKKVPGDAKAAGAGPVLCENTDDFKGV